MLLLTKQWEGDNGRKGQGGRAQKAEAALMILGFGQSGRGRDGLRSCNSKGPGPLSGTDSGGETIWRTRDRVS